AHRLFVFSNPVDGREDEYNDWYDDVHIAEVLEVDGFVACQRFTAAGGDDAPARYLAVYEMDADDPIAAYDTLRASVGEMNVTDAIDRSSVTALIFTARGERVSVR
ncbi:MAG: hypothetical protein AAF480_10355, partial [Actinomycetota bacterium]